MSKDLDIIEELKQNFNLEKKDELDWNDNGYVVDDNGNVTGLSFCEKNLKQIPNCIFQLTNLKKLFLYNNQLKDLPAEIVNLTHLTELYLWNNQLKDLPAEIGNLTHLTSLDLDNNQLEDLPAEIGNLTNLTELNLRNNQLKDLPAEIGNLTNLTVLNLDDNQLKDLPAEIRNLTNLTVLNLGDNQLEDLPAEIGNLTHLTWLSLYKNQLKELPAEIVNLTHLTSLSLANNQLEDLPADIGNLTHLTWLNLDDNQLEDLPAEIGNLTNLTWLSLTNNQLKDLPAKTGNLTNLTRLDLGNNQLKEIPINLANNFLDIGIKWEYDGEKGLYLEGNPLEFPPPEIIKSGTEALKNYFKSTEKSKKVLNEVKVLLVGEGAAGKTSLLKQLEGKPFDKNESQTHGINICHNDVKTKGGVVKAHYWDFGGQEIMHATHQFFLSKRSLYILVIDKRREEKNEYWLKLIQSFGGNSPILLVLNKIDENPGFYVNEKDLLGKYKNIKGFFHVSCKKNEGIEELKQKIAETLMETPICSSVWSPEWFKIKEQLENQKEPYIPYEEYNQICDNNNIKDESSQKTLIQFLNDLGSIIYFDNPKLKHTHVLNPRWITEAVYRIINSKIVEKNKGLLKGKDLEEILKQRYDESFEYPLEKHQYIIELMGKFKLCYPVGNDIFLPALLDVQEPDYDFDIKNCLNFIIKYDFLPKSIFPRFMVKMYKSLETQWRTGLIIKDGHSDAKALIKVDEEEKRIFIYVNGQEKKDYFASILYGFREINDSFEKMTYKELVPMPDDQEITVSYDHLLYLNREGDELYAPDGAKRKYKVNDLLGHITYFNEPLEMILKRIEKIINKIDKNNPESIKEAKSKILMLKPNVFGCGVDLNEAIAQIPGKEKIKKVLVDVLKSRKKD